MTNDGNKILVIDDDVMVRKGVVAYLEDSGFEVFEADDGRSGLETYQQYNPDLVICDLRMPNVDGISVLKSLSNESARVPVIVVSGAGVMSDVVEALRLGASDYFIKPVQDLELLEISIKRSLNEARLRKENHRYRRKLEQANRDLKANLDVLEQDQQAGRYVQIKMLPETPKILNGYEFSHYIIPSLVLSGDFVEYLTVGDNYVTFFMADVSGHGASSAFVTVLLKNLAARLRSSYTHTGEQTILSPIDFLDKANDELLSLELGKHVTLFFGVLDTEQNCLRYSVAAHLPEPILADGVDARALMGRGRPVGLFEDAVFNEHTVQLPEKFSLTLFSDGILEILPQLSLAEKEAYLLDTLKDGLMTLDQIIGRLGLDNVQDAPDDIAVMTISKVKGNAVG